MSTKYKNAARRRVEVAIVPLELGRSDLGPAIVTGTTIIAGSRPSADAAAGRIVELVRGRLQHDLAGPEVWDRSGRLREAVAWEVSVNIRDLNRRGARARVRSHHEFMVHRSAEFRHWNDMVTELRRGLTRSLPLWTQALV